MLAHTDGILAYAVAADITITVSMCGTLSMLGMPAQLGI